MPLKTPDLTAAQLVAAISSIAGLFVSTQYIDGRTEQLVTGVAAIVVPIVWVLADAVIRHGRSVAQGQAGSASVELSASVPAAKAPAVRAAKK